MDEEDVQKKFNQNFPTSFLRYEQSWFRDWHLLKMIDNSIALSVRFFQQIIVLGLFCLLLSVAISACAKWPLENHSKDLYEMKLVTKLVKCGALHYTYENGCFIPLRNGTILAYGGQLWDSVVPIRAQDGKIYGNEPASMVEIFDPKDGSSRVLTKLPFQIPNLGISNPRQMKGIELQNGKILFIGCFIDTLHPVSFRGFRTEIAPAGNPRLFGILFDPQTFKYQEIHSPEDIPGRTMVCLDLLDDGRVLITGGSISGRNIFSDYKELPETRVLVFDPKDNSIRVIGQLTHTRYGHSVVRVSKTQFKLFGGIGVGEKEKDEMEPYMYNADGTVRAEMHFFATREVEMFDLATGKSKVVGHTLRGRHDFSILPLSEQKFLISGGAKVSSLGHWAAEIYDNSSNQSLLIGMKRDEESVKISNNKTPLSFLGEGAYFRSAINSKCCVFAGIQDAYVYQNKDLLKEPPVVSNFERLRLLAPRTYHNVICCNDGLYILGGNCKSNVVEKLEVSTTRAVGN